MRTRKFKIRINGWLSAIGKLFPKKLNYTCPIPPFHKWKYHRDDKLIKINVYDNTAEYVYEHTKTCKKCGKRVKFKTHGYT